MSESKGGCSVAVVALVAALMLVVGVAAGGGIVWFLYVGDAGTVTPTPTDLPTPQPPEPPHPPKVGMQRYAALLPLEETLRIDGPLPVEEVKEAVMGKRFKLRECYQQGVERSPDLKGEMSLQFTVAASNGAVIAAIERHTDFADKKVRDCILKEVKGWEFKPQKAQSTVKFDVLMMSMSGDDAQ